MKEQIKNIFWAHFETPNQKRHKVSAKVNKATKTDFFEWLNNEVESIKEEEGSCIVVNCGMI